MDKNKNRTDLLAAGRKKLQQFRQKKDVKGGSSLGKSSKKASKSGSSTVDAASRPQDSEVEAASQPADHAAVSAPAPPVPGDPLVSEMSGVSSSEATDPEAPGPPSSDLGADEPVPAPSQVEGESLGTTTVHGEVTSSGVPEDPDSQEKLPDASLNLDSSRDAPASTSHASGEMTAAESTGSAEDEESSLSREYILVGSMSHAEGSQVGAKQEADTSVPAQFNGDGEMDLGRTKTGPASEIAVTSEPQSSSESTARHVEEARYEMVQADESSASAVSGHDSHDKYRLPSGSMLEADGFLTVSHECRDQEREDRPGVEGSFHIDSSSLDGKGDEADVKGREVEEGSRDSERHMEIGNATSTRLTATNSADFSSVSLSQLIDVVKRLGEDDYNLLLASRDTSSSGNNERSGDARVQECIPSDLEQLEEELFLANFTKDVLRWQLEEHSKFQEEFHRHQQQFALEISVLQSSVDAVNKKNDGLTEQIELLKAQLQAVTSERDDLQNHLHAKKLEVEELNERAHGLQTDLDVFQQNLSTQSIELADCKSSLAALQMENHKLSRDIVLVTEEKNLKEEEKDNLSLMNEKLAVELAECQNLVGSLREEVSTLGDTLFSVRDVGKKLEEEKECLANEVKRLSTTLADSKRLVEELQIERDNFSERLGAELGELEKTKTERELFSIECERLSSELHSSKEQMSSEKERRMRSEEDLKEKIISLEKLAEENRSLNAAQRSEFKNNQIYADLTDAADHFQQFDEVITKQDDGVTLPVTKSVPTQDALESPHELVEQQVPAALSGLEALKGHSLELDNIVQKLEVAIESMHSFSTNKSDKEAAPGVSKLIQAFELKGHIGEQNEEVESTMEDQSVVDPYISSKENIRNLKLMGKQLVLDVENVALLLSTELKHRRSADVKVGQLEVQNEIFKEHADSLEVHTIELGVLYEVAKQHLSESELRKAQLETDCGNLKQQDIILRAENEQLILKLEDYESRANNLQNQLHDLQRTSGDLISSLGEQLETLQRETTESAVMNQLSSSFLSAQIVDSVQVLDKFTSMIPAQNFIDLDLGSYVAYSVSAVMKVIEELQEKLEVVERDKKAIDDLCQETNDKLHFLQGKSDLSIRELQHLYHKLRELVISTSRSMEQDVVQTEEKELLDPIDETKYDSLLERLEIILSERQRFASEVIALQSQLSDRMQDIRELEAKCIDTDSVQRLIADVGGVVELEAADSSLSGHPLAVVESLIHALVQNCRENKHVGRYTEEIESKEMQLAELDEKSNQLSSLNLQHENEIVVLRESLAQAEEALVAVRAELKEKAVELEQSEQRVSSIREKLGIAVSKGKGLVVQRDHLKQTLAETSTELEKCSKELELNEARLHELETKLVTYSEAGERVEALESELSYIRNSATALRESFLLKDSLLQRIEEILEDLDLPEHFHFKDIIEKVDWLARSVAGNSVNPADLDHKDSVGGSYSDTGFAAMDAWRDDMQSSSNPNEDLRRKYDELQGKFYGLAEQNEMLEQSLMERNNLVQRWEGLLDRINVPMQARSVEPEEKIEWLSKALSEAHDERKSLQEKIDDVEIHCGSLTSDLEDSHHSITNLQNEIEVLVSEREHLSHRLEMLTQNNEELSTKALELESQKETLLSETNHLHEELGKRVQDEEKAQRIEQEIQNLQDMVAKVLLDPVTEDSCSRGSSTEVLAVLLKKLTEKYSTAFSDTVVSDREGPVRNDPDSSAADLRTRETLNADEQGQGTAVLKKELEEALGELMLLKEQRDEFLEKNKSLIDLVESLERKRDELQSLLAMEEQKCTSVREKLNVAVRKGKSLVQQRDVLKSTIEEMNKDVDQLKSEVSNKGDALAKCEQKIQELSSYPERVGALESEISYLRNQLTETEHVWQEKEHVMGLVLSTLAEIDVGGQVDATDPVEKLRQIQEICSGLRAAAASLEQESKKSRRAAELLLVELNEVQERNDGLQEQIAEAASEITRLSQEKDAAVLQLNTLSSHQSEERRSISSEFIKLKLAVELLGKIFSGFQKSMADVFWQEIEILKKVEISIGSCLQQNQASGDGIRLTISSALAGSDFHKIDQESFPFTYPGSHNMSSQFDENLIKDLSFIGKNLQDLFVGIGVLKEDSQKHFAQLQEQATSLSEVLNVVHQQMVSRKESSEVTERDIKHLTSIQKEKDMEIVSLRRNMALLHEACSISLMEIENSKAALTGNGLSILDQGVNRNATTYTHHGFSVDDHIDLSSEESVRSFADRMISAAKGWAHSKDDAMEVAQKQLKNRVADLQKELQEKDLQKDRICMELVGQIKAAEAAATDYSLDLQSTKALVHDLEMQIKAVEEERNLSVEKVRNMQDREMAAEELQERLRSMTGLLASKDQEIEALMQALDEEEVQMDGLTKKIEGLEKIVQQKDLVVEELEISRGKALKKLSITMNKFHELHQFSSSVLAEVEKLQIQLKDKDAEISFLRQEVTRCTNDALVATQLSNNRNSPELLEVLLWFDTLISQVASPELHHEKTNQIQEYKELIQKKFTSVVSELENLRVTAENKEALLLAEKSKKEELMRKELSLEKSLREKESQLNLLQGFEDSGSGSGLTSEIVEIEPLINKRTVSASTAPQVRSLRKPNNDQVAIAIDMDPDSTRRLEDEDDDKVHGFKSLATSRVIPKFTRRLTDMVDGLWVSCDRTLMRQPILRLGIIIYWAVLHALLATFIV